MRSGRRAGIGLALVAVAVSGCQEAGADALRRGAARVVLQLERELDVDTIEYAVGELGFQEAVILGTTPVEGRVSEVRTMVYDLRPEERQRLVAAAYDRNGAVVCGGAEEFTVLAGTVTDLRFPLACADVLDPEAPLGTAGVGGIGIGIRVCPVITLAAALPNEALSGELVELRGEGMDPLGGPVEYRWRADRGSISDPSTPRTDFRCACLPGVDECLNAVTLIVSNGSGCAVSHAIPIQCRT